MLPGETHGQYLAVRAKGKGCDNRPPLMKEPTDFMSGREVPGPDLAVIITGRHELAVGMEGNGGNPVGVRDRREQQPARARLPEAQLAGRNAVRIAPGRERSTVGTECKRENVPTGVVLCGRS